MTVDELREALADYPGDMEVLCDDNEAGPRNICTVRTQMNPDWSPQMRTHMQKYGLKAELAVVLS